MIALILTSGVLGIFVNLVFRFIERKVLFWHTSVRSEVAA
jgi:ABC-type nitrate/sulfonate/bicarbonate transport system permease component